MKKITLSFLLLISAPFALAQDAVYTVTFNSNWSQATHPHSSGSLPAGAHWSRLVGATHNASISFLEMGGLATDGIEDIAEQGNNAAFFNEVDAAITAGTADKSINGPDLDTALGSIVLEDLVVSEDYSLLTLASMIAPSPDWMIAISSVDLYDDVAGDWKNEIVIDLYPYDAGTDSGADYGSPNANTSPAEPISSLQGTTPFSSDKIGTITIAFQGVLNVDQNSLRDFSISPNPAQDLVVIDGGNELLQEVLVYNTLGRIVKSYQASPRKKINFSLANLTSGLYLVQVKDTQGRSAVKKLIKR